MSKSAFANPTYIHGVLAIPQSMRMSSVSNIFSTLSLMDFKPECADMALENWRKIRTEPLSIPRFCQPTYLLFFLGQMRNLPFYNQFLKDSAFSLLNLQKGVLAVEVVSPEGTGVEYDVNAKNAALNPSAPYVKPTIWTLG